jgi:hypothetical protein
MVKIKNSLYINEVTSNVCWLLPLGALLRIRMKKKVL